MSNESIKRAVQDHSEPLGCEIELLDHELDEIAGGSCKSFHCSVYKIV